MNRIIINNKTDLPELTAIELVSGVIKAGRISNDNKQYCYLTSLRINNTEYHIVTDLRKNSDSFTIYKPQIQ